MAADSYTEEEFKKVLKNLFSEKKKVKDLEKQLEERGIQKRFQAKLADIHKFSLTEEYAKLKASYLEKENECAQIKSQLERVRPILKKLMVDLKSATAEVESLKSQPQQEVEALKRELASVEQEVQEGKQRVHTLEIELVKKSAEKNLLEEQHQLLLGELKSLRESSEKEAKEAAQKLIEQSRDSAMALDKACVGHESEIIQLKEALDKAQAEFEKSDFVALRKEYELKVDAALVTFSQKEKAHEEALEHCYVKMREMSQRHGESVEEREQLYKKLEDHKKILAKREKEQTQLQSSLKNAHLQAEEQEAELRKAQHHLAKKMKETTLLEDSVESLKGQLNETQTKLSLQQEHEVKMTAALKERALSAEQSTKEWQEKYHLLQKEFHGAKEELGELQQLRKTYEQMAITFSNLKHIIGHIPTDREPTTD